MSSYLCTLSQLVIAGCVGYLFADMMWIDNHILAVILGLLLSGLTFAAMKDPAPSSSVLKAENVRGLDVLAALFLGSQFSRFRMGGGTRTDHPRGDQKTADSGSDRDDDDKDA